MEKVRELAKKHRESLIVAGILLAVLIILGVILVSVGKGAWILQVLSFFRGLIWAVIGLSILALPGYLGFKISCWTSILDNLLGDDKVPYWLKSALVLAVGAVLAVAYVYSLDALTRFMPAVAAMYGAFGDVGALHESPVSQYGWLMWFYGLYGVLWYVHGLAHYNER